MMSLLHPHFLRCRPEVGVSRHMKFFINPSIGIEAKSLYQFMNRCHGILCFWHNTFGLVPWLLACNLKQFGRLCPTPPQKWQNHWSLCCFLPTRWVGCLGLVLLIRSTLIFLVAKTSSLWTLTFGLGIDTGVTNLAGVTTKGKPLSI